MNEVTVNHPPPTIVRWITCFAGIFVLVAAPAYGVNCIVTQHVEQSPQNKSDGRHSEGFELYGPAAVVFGVGFIGLGLSMGYGFAFRISRKTSFKITPLDKVAIGLLLVSIALLVVAQFLPTRTAWGTDPPSGF